MRPISEVAIPYPNEAFNEVVDISPLDALLGEVKRTAGKIAWLERLIASLGLSEMFGDIETTEQTESNAGRMGRVGAQGDSPSARVKWLLANEGERTQRETKRRLGLHPAIKWLLDERKHLVSVSSQCLAIGIKLDHIELTKRQGEQMLQGMLLFAEQTGQDLESEAVKNALEHALNGITMQ
jgi:hypothetical protein